MGSCVGDDSTETEVALKEHVDEQAERLGISLSNSSSGSRFKELIIQASQRSPVVVLIDEYDKPLLGHLGQSSATEVQKLLKSFYGVIKTTEDRQRFALITEISKFSKVSIFSDLNNLTDLTMQRSSATLLGYTQQELESNFSEQLLALGQECGFDQKTCLEKLKRWYNGYRFEENAPTVYNPVSVMKCLMENKFKNFWFETATPTFLIDILKRIPLSQEDLTVPEIAFSAHEPNDLQPLPLLFQMGYLTIVGVEKLGEETWFKLGYPNHEVERSFSHYLAKGMAEIGDTEMSKTIRGIKKCLDSADVDGLFRHFRVFFKGIPYTIQLDNEKYYQSLFFAVIKMLGAIIEAEVCTSGGRIDALIRTDTRIFVLELKLHGTAEDALAQIKSKDDTLPYEFDGRRLLLIGAAFDPKTRNLEDWLVEESAKS
jgi:hypothetical protein